MPQTCDVFTGDVPFQRNQDDPQCGVVGAAVTCGVWEDCGIF